MEKIYSTAKICSFEDENQCDLSLEPGKIFVASIFFSFSISIRLPRSIPLSDIDAIMKTSRDEEELRHVWIQWRNVTGRPIKEHYERFVELSNEAARLNGMKLSFNSKQKNPSKKLLINLDTKIKCVHFRLQRYWGHVVAKLWNRFIQRWHRWIVVHHETVLPRNSCLRSNQIARSLRGFCTRGRWTNPSTFAR